MFVGGVHGVGKTTLSRLVAAALQASHITAGGLIRSTASASHIVTVGVGDKAVPDVDGNQSLLLRGLELYRAQLGPGTILLDGHFALVDDAGELAEVPLRVYELISPAGLLLIESDPDAVHERLKKRDGAALPIKTIIELAERERVRAGVVSAHLNIPIWVIRGDGDPSAVAQMAASQVRSILDGDA